LTPGGLLVANLHASHPHVPIYIDRLASAAAATPLRVNDRDGTNCVVFVRRGQPLVPARAAAPVAGLQDACSRIAHAVRMQHRSGDA